MTDEIKDELSEAKALYKSKKYDEALEKYEKIYLKNSEEFGKWDKIFYSWSIYQLHVKNFEDETELIDSAKLIMNLTTQSDLNKTSTCAYTLSVFKVLDYFYKNEEYACLLDWLDKIDFTLLDYKPYKTNGRLYPSRKEKYFNYASKAYFECKDYGNCILISDKALREFNIFTNDSDVWFNWRIAKSLKELNQLDKALVYLDKVSKVKKDWFIPKEIAENYFILGDEKNAIKYVADAILTDEPANIKVNLYHLTYKLLKDDEPDIALKHAELVSAIKLENNVALPNDIDKLDIDESNLDVDELETQIKEYWLENKFKNQKLLRGMITKLHDNGRSGFITSDDYERYYFNVSEFKDDILSLGEGLYVSFYTQKGFDRSKNKESIEAVNIHIDNIN
ncbi:hypothetical protein [Methanobrevibacter millerae]|uniref:TPR repeat-containing protein n=1 Tax=Methanobrevibacter millerae TaxID=230361 RepID=A0A0U3CTH2_9EURY|nr:hypothetical protein [Methanobrevibacter millerae]ALT68975.1 TPR repeat-containing protein [Methanobrevibacter millerae]